MTGVADRIVPWVGRVLPSRLVLTFHGIGTPGRTIDSGEARYWVDPSVLAESVASAKTDPATSITFDDGNTSDYRIAYPMLQAAGLKATFFVLAGRLDQPGSLARHEIVEMAAGGMAIGSHGHDHVDWTKCSDAVMRRELHDARASIEDCLGARVDEVSIPFGAFDARVLRLILEAGYRAVHTSLEGRAAQTTWLVPRNSVRSDWVLDRELARLRSWRTWIGSTLRQPLWNWRYRVNTWRAVPSR